MKSRFQILAWAAAAIAALSIPARCGGGDELIGAIASRDVAKVRSLLDGGADPSAKDSYGNQPLQMALQVWPDSAFVSLLLDHGADIDAKGSNRLTPFQTAVRHGRPRAARMIFDKGAKWDGDRELAGALLHGDDASVRTRLAAGVKVDKGEPPPIFIASLTSSSASINALLAAGAKPEANWYGMRPLHAAAAAGNLSAIGALLERGASIEAKDGEYTPFLSALQSGQADAAKLLLERGAKDKVSAYKMKALDVAVQGGSAEAVELLLSRGADPNAPNAYGAAPLTSAITTGDAELVKALLDHGADASAKDKYGSTPSGFAAVKGDPKVIRLLAGKGADFSGQGLQILIVAVEHGSTDLVRVVEELRLDVTQYAAVEADAARKKGHPEVASLIEDTWPSDPAKIAKRKAEREAEASRPRIEAAERAGDKAAAAGDAAAAMASYSEALAACPAGTEPERRIESKALELGRGKNLPVPEDVERHLTRARVFVQKASNADGYQRAILEFQEAAKAAPWLPETYYNLGLVQEKAADYAGATASLKLYLEGAPDSPDAPAVKKRLYAIEAEQELAEGKK